MRKGIEFTDINMETNMTNEKALNILERHNLWRRGADYAEPTDPKLLGMAIDKAIEVLRLSVAGQSEQLCPVLADSLPPDIRDEMDGDMEDSGMAQGEIESCLNHWSNKYTIRRR